MAAVLLIPVFCALFLLAGEVFWIRPRAARREARLAARK